MTTREVRGSALHEFLMRDGHRIPKALRDNPGDLQSATERMTAVLKCTRKNPKGQDVEDIVSVTYDGIVCPDAKSTKRIFAIARDSGGKPMTTEQIAALVSHLNSIDWYSITKKMSEGAEKCNKKRRFGKMMFKSYNGKEQTVDELGENDKRLAKSFIKAGRYSREIGVPCVFAEDGAPVSKDR